jgi:replicative DNA helicase
MGTEILMMSDMAALYLESAAALDHRIPLGYPALDAVIRGIAPGEVLTVLGRSGEGKSALMLNLIRSMTGPTARRPDGIATLVLSLEQPAAQLWERIASVETGHPGREIEELATREHPMIADEFRRVCEAAWHVAVRDGALAVGEIGPVIQRAKEARPGLRLVALDHLGLVAPAAPNVAQYEHVTQAMREIKNAARRSGVAVMLLAHAGRVGDEPGTSVVLSDIRDSSAVEEMSDYVLGAWRPELQFTIRADERELIRGLLRVAVLKNRCGPAPRYVEFRLDEKTLGVSAGKEMFA